MALKIKVKGSTHRKISFVCKYLCWFGYIAAMLVAGNKSLSNYLYANQIMQDHTVVDAALEFDGITEERRKKRTIETYHFSYQFELDGQIYGDEFTTSKGNADDFLNTETVKVAYSNADPKYFGRLEFLERNDSFLSNLWRWFLGGVLGMGFVALLSFYLFTEVVFVNKDKKPDEEDESQDSKPATA